MTVHTLASILNFKNELPDNNYKIIRVYARIIGGNKFLGSKTIDIKIKLNAFAKQFELEWYIYQENMTFKRIYWRSWK